MADAFHVNGVVSAKAARLNDGGLLAVLPSGPLDVRTGVMPGPNSLNLVTGTSATAPMTVNVAAHHWVTTRGTANGSYRGTKEASTALTIGAAPGSGTRIDVVYVKMQDNTGGVPTPDGVVGELYGVLAGTVGAGKPNLATIVGAEELATVAVSAGATATNGAGVVITNTARQTSTRGGIMVARSTDTDNGAYTGHYRDHPTSLLQRWNGSAWAAPVDPAAVLASLPVAFLTQTTAQSGLAAGWQTISLDSELIDSHSGHSTSTNNSRWTCPTGQGGTYVISGVVQTVSGGSERNARIRVNGNTFRGCSGTGLTNQALSGTTVGTATGNKYVVLAPGDYVELQGYSQSIWATFTFADGGSNLTVERIR